MLKPTLMVFFLLLISATAYASEPESQVESDTQLKELSFQLELLNRKYDLAVQGMNRGSTGVGLAAGLALVLVVSAAWTYNTKGTAWIGGAWVTFIFLILVGGLVLYFAYVFDREADIRGEISETTRSIALFTGKCK